MDKSSKESYTLEHQVRAWNEWNETTRGDWMGDARNETSRRQAEIVESSIAALGRHDLSIIEVGCGSGWLCERLQAYGQVTGTDLADEVLGRASKKWPKVRFISGDFMTLDLPMNTFDVVVTLEVLSHLPDQPAFVARLADLLKPGGLLIVATQNRPVLERWSAIGGPTPGQVRKWVNARELRSLMIPHFSELEIDSIVPVGDEGFLRVLNSAKLNRLLQLVIPERTIQRAKERAMLGHTLIAKGRKS